jgi:hypothetical protein
MTSPLNTRPQQAWPAWYREFRRLFRAGTGHGFVLTGDIYGVTAFGASQRGFLQHILHQSREVVACYHPATGITFALPSMRALALEMLGPDWQPPQDDSNPYTTALDALVAERESDVFVEAKKPKQALAILDHLLRAPLGRARVAVVLDGADLIMPATSKALMPDERLAVLAMLLHWGQDSQLASQYNPILLLTPRLSELHPDLRASTSGYRVIEQPLPDEQTRLAYITWYLHTQRQEQPITLLDLNEADLARNTAGLNLRQVEDVLFLGTIPDDLEPASAEPVGVSRHLVKARKDALIRQQYSELVEMLEPLAGGFASLGGMQLVTSWFRGEVIAPLRAGQIEETPKGILFVGPPGNGKTLLVQAAAWELGFNAMALRMANILGGVVGTSERNLADVFTLARSLAPTFLFLDEIDQSHLGNRGQHSGSPVAANLFGALLQFLSDETLRGRVIVVGATNHPELLDAALLRAGRFDVIFPILSPEQVERRDMLLVQARRLGVSASAEVLDLLAEETERYSAADLESLLKEARLLMRQDGQSVLAPAHARGALDNLRPVTLASVDAFSRRAIDACNNLRYLPPALASQERARFEGLCSFCLETRLIHQCKPFLLHKLL